MRAAQYTDLLPLLSRSLPSLDFGPARLVGVSLEIRDTTLPLYMNTLALRVFESLLSTFSSWLLRAFSFYICQRW